MRPLPLLTRTRRMILPSTIARDWMIQWSSTSPRCTSFSASADSSKPDFAGRWNDRNKKIDGYVTFHSRLTRWLTLCARYSHVFVYNIHRCYLRWEFDAAATNDHRTRLRREARCRICTKINLASAETVAHFDDTCIVCGRWWGAKITGKFWDFCFHCKARLSEWSCERIVL